LALRLDRPRAWFEDAVGREHATIDVEIELPPAPPPRTETTGATGVGSDPSGEGRTSTGPVEPEEPERLAFTPRDPMRLWVADDSLVITPGYAVYRAFGRNDAVELVGDLDGRVATGLTRPDVFNWFRHVDEQVREERIDTVVFGFGGNDDHDYMTGVPEGVSLHGFGGPKWTMEYRRRVGGLMDTANQAGALVVWLGLPITDDSAQSRRFRILNKAAAAEAVRRPDTVAYVDMYSLLSDDDGGYAPYLPDAGGRLAKVRTDDGVHVERAGGDLVAKEVVRRLRPLVDVWSWKAQE
jgi:hypothetical protein